MLIMNKLFTYTNFLHQSRKLLDFDVILITSQLPDVEQRVRKIFSLTAISLLTLVSPAQALPIPQGFKLMLSDTGVQVYQQDRVSKNPDYVTVVNLEKGNIRNLIGTSENMPNGIVKKKLLTEFWQDAVKQNTSTRKVRVVINASFFSTNNNPTGIAFGLKVDNRIISYGYAIGKEYPGQIRTFSFNLDQKVANIQNYTLETFNSTPDVVGALDAIANKSENSYLPRTFVGIRDDDGNGTTETVIFYSSSFARQIDASQVLKGFGASATAMLDGGGSTFLVVDGKPLISTNRKVPHAIAVYAGK